MGPPIGWPAAGSPAGSAVSVSQPDYPCRVAGGVPMEWAGGKNQLHDERQGGCTCIRRPAIAVTPPY